MKFIPIVSSLLAVALATPSPEEMAAPKPGSGVNGELVLPRFKESSPKDGATRKTVKYGSFMVSSAKMLSTTRMAKGPCGGSCYVTAMEATIRYPGGKEANVDTGAWLHHIALFGGGAGAGTIWAAGNERPTLRLNTQKKFGIAFPAQFMLMIDLMVETQQAKNLTLEITYETIPKTNAGYKPAKMYWLTIGEPAAKKGVFQFTTMPQTSKVSGSLLYAIGHMHDGGTYMALSVGGKVVCKSKMFYNAREGYGKQSGGNTKSSGGNSKSSGGKGNMAGMSGMDHQHGHKLKKRQHSHGAPGTGSHISDPGACIDFGTVKTGQQLKATAYYDATKHELMMHNGKAEKLMGNMRVYIGPEGGAAALGGGMGGLGGKAGGGLGGLGGKAGGGLGGLGGLGGKGGGAKGGLGGLGGLGGKLGKSAL